MNFFKPTLAAIAALVVMVGAFAQPASAQSNRYYNDNYNWVTPSWRAPKYKKRYRHQQGYGAKKYYGKAKKNPAVLSGGPRPYIAPKRPKVVKFRKKYKNGSIVIDTKKRRLYYVLGKGRAYSYPIAVGKQGFAWTGTSKISAKKNWPDWRPPKEMRQRKPNLPKLMHGGLYNPLGAKALYLGKSLYRIHGTNNAKSIGTASSSGCFRMLNSHVAHLSKITKIGAKVYVKSKL